MQGRLTGAIVNPYVLLGVFFMALFITCYFVDIHVDVAEALMVAFLAEFEIDQIGYKDMNIARESLKNAINDLDHDFALKEEQKFKHWVMIFCKSEAGLRLLQPQHKKCVCLHTLGRTFSHFPSTVQFHVFTWSSLLPEILWYSGTWPQRMIHRSIQPAGGWKFSTGSGSLLWLSFYLWLSLFQQNEPYCFLSLLGAANLESMVGSLRLARSIEMSCIWFYYASRSKFCHLIPT